MTAKAHHVTGRWDGLGFDLRLPAGWTLQLPATGAIDFEQFPAAMQCLAVAACADSRLQLEVSARPLKALLPLACSAIYYMGEHGVELSDEDDGDADGRCQVGACAALCAAGRLHRGGSCRAVRCAYLEHGDRVIELLLHGPESAAVELEAAWQLVLESFQPCPGPAPDSEVESKPDSRPADWWLQARALEAGGRLAEALALVERECRQAGALLAQAELMARQIRRRLEAGEPLAVCDEHDAAQDFAQACAGTAGGGGGEESALSVEPDRFLDELGPAPAIGWLH